MLMKNKILSRKPSQWLRPILLIKGRLKNGHKIKRRDFKVELAAEPHDVIEVQAVTRKTKPPSDLYDVINGVQQKSGGRL